MRINHFVDNKIETVYNKYMTCSTDNITFGIPVNNLKDPHEIASLVSDNWLYKKNHRFYLSKEDFSAIQFLYNKKVISKAILDHMRNAKCGVYLDYSFSCAKVVKIENECLNV